MKNKHRLFIKMAELVADQSTCCRLQVGAVLVKDNRVISMGFNGTPTGQRHCEENFRAVYEAHYRDKFPTYMDFVASRTFYDLHGKCPLKMNSTPNKTPFPLPPKTALPPWVLRYMLPGPLAYIVPR